MAKPITPTPAFLGEEAERLEKSLNSGATPAEMDRRAVAARKHVEELLTPRDFPKRPAQPSVPR